MRVRLLQINRSFLLAVIFMGVLYGQVTSDYVYKGSRSAALAGSGGATVGNAWAIFNNPAALSRIQSLEGTLSHYQLFGQSYLPYFVTAAGVPLPGSLGSAGVGLEQMSVSYGGNNLSSESALFFSHGFFLQKDFYSTLAFGYSIKYLQLDYGMSAGLSGDGSDGISLGTGSMIGVDIGLQASRRGRHWVGVFVSNINRPKIGKGSSSSQLPQRLQMAFGYSPYTEVWSLFTITKAAGHETQYHAGIEYNLFENVRLMFGSHTAPNRFGTGASFNFKGISLDYGLITHPVLPLTHQFSIGIKR